MMYNPIKTVFKEYVSLILSSDVIKYVKPKNIIIPGDPKWVHAMGCSTYKKEFQDSDYPALGIIPLTHQKYGSDSCAMTYDLNLRWQIQLGDNIVDILFDINYAFIKYNEMARKKLRGQRNLITELRSRQDETSVQAITTRDTWSTYCDVVLVIAIPYSYIRKDIKEDA